MRTLARWSESSLSMTTPRPEKAEPSRCMASPFPRALLGVSFEIACIDRLQVRLLNAEIFQASLHGDDLGGRLRPHVPVGVQADFADTGLLDPAHPRDKREALRQAHAISVDINDITAAQHPRAERVARPKPCGAPNAYAGVETTHTPNSDYHRGPDQICRAFGF